MSGVLRSKINVELIVHPLSALHSHFLPWISALAFYQSWACHCTAALEIKPTAGFKA